MQLMSLVFYVGTGWESIYGGKFAIQLAHAFLKYLRFEQSDLYYYNCIKHSIFLIIDDNFWLCHDGPSILSIANVGLYTNGCQFFITFAGTPRLDGYILDSIFLNVISDFLYSLEFVWTSLHVGCDRHIFSLSMTHECHHMEISYLRTPMVLSSLLLLQQHLILMGIYLIPYLWFFVFTWVCLSSFTCWLWSTYFLFIHDSWVSPYGNFIF